MAEATFIYEGEDEECYTVNIEGEDVCEVRADEMTLGDSALQPVWDALGIKLNFIDRERNNG